MANTYTKLLTGALMIYILLVFLTTNNTLFGYCLLAMILAMAFALPTRKHFTKIPKRIMCGLFIVAICILVSFFFADYMQKYTVACYACLILMYLLTDSGMMSESLAEKPLIDWFYLLLMLLTLINIYMSIQLGEEDTVFSVIGEKNYTAVFVFCVFLYSNKRRYLSGIVLAFVYAAFLTQSRSFLLLLLLFYFFWFMPEKIKTFLDNHKIHFFIIFLLLFIAIAVFSFYWVYNVSVSGLVDYKAGLNDGSNRMRFVANIKAFQMLAEPSKTLLWGYSDHLLEALGVTSENYAYHTHFLGVRLVQPHNSLINPLVTMGIVPGVIYWYILADLLNKFNTKENLPYIFPFVVNAMIMHSMFELQWLVFWIFILAIPQQKRKRGIVFTYGNKGKKKRQLTSDI